MANSRKITIPFVVLGWTVTAAFAGAAVDLAHLLRESSLTILMFQFVVYSCGFGFCDGSATEKSTGERMNDLQYALAVLMRLQSIATLSCP
jgi:hypothetical protein